MPASLLDITAPAGSCDFAGRGGAGRFTRGCARGPILSNSFHDLAGERSNAHPGITFLPAGHVPPATFPRLGFGRARASINARCGTSCQIIRREPHGPISKSNVPMQSLYCIGGSSWWVSHPQARVNHPRTAPEKR